MLPVKTGSISRLASCVGNQFQFRWQYLVVPPFFPSGANHGQTLGAVFTLSMKRWVSPIKLCGITSSGSWQRESSLIFCRTQQKISSQRSSCFKPTGKSFRKAQLWIIRHTSHVQNLKDFERTTSTHHCTNKRLTHCWLYSNVNSMSTCYDFKTPCRQNRMAFAWHKGKTLRHFLHGLPWFRLAIPVCVLHLHRFRKEAHPIADLQSNSKNDDRTWIGFWS